MKKVTVIGGGTGSFVLLSALKYLPIRLSSIVNMTDNGGSTGKLRDQLGILPPGDVRQCLVALSEDTSLWRELFTYRFENGDLKGHNVGNILISALEKISPDYMSALDAAGKVLKVKGRVLPITLQQAQLSVVYENGEVLTGEEKIDEQIVRDYPIKQAFLTPEVEANPKALKAIFDADSIIISPGDIFTSIVPILITKGVKEAMQSFKGQIIYIVNIMTRSGQTQNFGVKKHIETISLYLGREPDVIIANNAKIPKEILYSYETEHEFPVKIDLQNSRFEEKTILADVINDELTQKNTSDIVHRSLLRHSPQKLLALLESYLL